jgi:hypothetical protein
MLAISVHPPDRPVERLVLLCTNCRQIAFSGSWVVGDLAATPDGEGPTLDSFIVEDSAGGLRIRCYTARLFDEDSYIQWLGDTRENVEKTGLPPQARYPSITERSESDLRRAASRWPTGRPADEGSKAVEVDQGDNAHLSSRIQVAGNTIIPCLQSVAAKGYQVKLCIQRSKPGDWDRPQWDAEKDGRQFSATSVEELLGLIAMWEVRGDDWSLKPGEVELYGRLVKSAPVYDPEGNVIDT